MPNYVRVRDNTGAKYSVVDTAVEDHMTVLKEPATDANGDPLRDEPAEAKSSTASVSKEK